MTILSLLGWPILSVAQPYTVGEQTINYQDSTRKRPVKVEIWYPTSDRDTAQQRTTELPFRLPPTIRNATFMNQSLPLIILSHGTGGNRFSLAWLAIELVRNGYIVAACDHWGNTYNNKVPDYFVRYWERPLDCSFLLTSLLTDPAFNTHIDQERIGMGGFSFGGYTALALGGAQLDCDLLKTRAQTKEGKAEFSIPELGDLRGLINELPCENVATSFKDDRFKAFIALAPVLGLGLPQKKQAMVRPVLIIGIENDQVAPLETNALAYNTLLPSSLLVKLEGKTGHYIFLNQATTELQQEAKTYYQDDKTVNRGVIHAQVATQVLAFLNQHLN